MRRRLEVFEGVPDRRRLHDEAAGAVPSLDAAGAAAMLACAYAGSAVKVTILAVKSAKITFARRKDGVGFFCHET